MHPYSTQFPQDMTLPCYINFLPWTSLALSFLLQSRVQLSGTGSPRLLLIQTDQGQEKGSRYLLPPTLPPKPFTSKQGSLQIAQWAFQCRNPGSSWCGKVKPICQGHQVWHPQRWQKAEE